MSIWGRVYDQDGSLAWVTARCSDQTIESAGEDGDAEAVELPQPELRLGFMGYPNELLGCC